MSSSEVQRRHHQSDAGAEPDRPSQEARTDQSCARLGLRKLNSSIELPDTESVRGMDRTRFITWFEFKKTATKRRLLGLSSNRQASLRR